MSEVQIRAMEAAGELGGGMLGGARAAIGNRNQSTGTSTKIGHNKRAVF
jgi:hypothetical protein